MAILRSRGASASQIFWSLVTQAVVLGLIALVAGPLLAILVTRLLAQYILTVADLGALNIVSGNPLPIVLSVGSYALITASTLVLTMILAIWSTASRDVLALRRETARSTHRPFWQRLNLDMVALVLALLVAGASLYLSNSSALDIRSRLLYLSPLTLLEAICILLAAMLLLLRGFPWVLRGGAWFTARLRGATSLIALAQMSRAPRQSMRMTLLLALATAFTIFTLVFNASQAQRIQDVADYQAMADFSGNVPVAVIPPQQLSSATQSYNRLPGVLSSSLGYVKTATAGGSALSLQIDFKAIDAGTFAQTARWSTLDSTQSLPSLMSQLVAQRSLANSKAVVPALVDAATWDELHLTPGANFTLNFSLVGAFDLVNFKAVAEVQHIPTSGNSSIPGVLADYTSFVSASTHNFTTGSGLTVPLNYVWLRTDDNPAQLAALRHQLNNGSLYLTPLYDRRQMVQQLANEPLYLTLFGILLLGAATALLLALLGNLVASWLNASSRLANFATLRALGASPRQIAGTLGWEQVIIYTTAILLGFFFGWLLSMLVLPSLIFTSILPNQISGSVDSQTFYAAQNTPPIQVVIPPALWIALGVLIALCIVALSMMVRIVSRPSIAQVLRLNED
jgi:ABC-type antimicrobial peptide transport system permease subunit